MIRGQSVPEVAYSVICHAMTRRSPYRCHEKTRDSRPCRGNEGLKAWPCDPKHRAASGYVTLSLKQWQNRKLQAQQSVHSGRFVGPSGTALESCTLVTEYEC